MNCPSLTALYSKWILPFLAVLWISIFSTTAQESALSKFLNFRVGNRNWTYLDTVYQKKLPSWRKESNGVQYKVNYALHKAGYELVLFLDFKSRLSKKEFAELELVHIHEHDSLFLALQRVDSNTVKLRFSEPQLGYSELLIFQNRQLLGILEIDVFEVRQERVYIVPLLDIEIDETILEQQINAYFQPYQLHFDLELLPSFYIQELEKNPLLDNPSPEYDHFTRQMRTIRDAYFNAFPNSDRRAYYFFIHQGFVNSEYQSYTSKGKAISFVKNQGINDMAYHISVELLRSIGSLSTPKVKNGLKELDASRQNWMLAQGGTDLNPEQWRKLHLEFRGYPYFDEEEEVNNFNGYVAYYFWEENDDGTIIFNPGAFRRAIQRPFKKNYFSYHLSIEKWFFKPLFSWLNYPLSPLHVLIFTVYSILALWLGRKCERKTLNWTGRVIKIKRLLARIGLSVTTMVLTIFTFSVINAILERYEVFEGVIPDFHGMETQEVRKQILYNTEIRRSKLPDMASEVLIKRGEDWIVKRRKRVLYFDLYKDSLGIYSVARFNRESDSIIVQSQGIAMLAPSHYFVINRIDENQKYESQMVFNHQGSNVTHLLGIQEEPAKRILLFVNGYRPTSLGNSLEENFRDIRERGVEFPNSLNMIHNFDRYDYWRPWREIDKRFEKRINPSETYYADGHFSVSTSNYRSLIHFTQVSSRYPARCKNPNKHICQHQGRTSWFRSSNDATYLLLPNRPNYSGFKLRMENGRIAGLNLVQQLNEIPNSSKNDTLYLVAHSMGFAYALGIIEELRGKINFGGFYILAPENASTGYVNPSEWKEVWQYGVNHEALKKTAPCLLDGVAPQTLAKGLESKHRVFIPNSLYRRFGFFDSHFVGFYDWIFDLDPKAPGGIMQR
jgi:hypothetical protein